MDAKHIPRLARIVAKSRSIRLSTLSTQVAKGGHVFKGLEEGTRSISLRKYSDFLIWFSDNWPEDLPWPEDIERPKVNDEDAA